MASGEVNLAPEQGAGNQTLPKLNLWMMMRIGLYQMGLGILAVLTLAVLNRVMIAELKIPAAITSSVLAISLLISPARIWVGQISDAKPWFGLHRSIYVWLGAALFTPTLLFVLQGVWQLGSFVESSNGWVWNVQTAGWTGLLALGMVLYGLSVSLSSVTFFALLVDVSDEDNRGQLIGIVWTMMTVGLAIGGIGSKVLLKPLDDINASMAVIRSSITGLFVVAPLLIFVLAFLATWGVEKTYSRYKTRSIVQHREDAITLGVALKVLTANRQTGIFFGFLVAMTFCLFLQESVLEPYGGEIFRMSIPDTSLLNTYWAVGMLFSLIPTGFFLIPRLGKIGTTKLGCWTVATCLVLIILAGFTENTNLLKGSLVFFGLATGILTTGGLSLTLDLTSAETAGTFSGAWGLGQALSRGIAVAAGGWVLSAGKGLFGVSNATEPSLQMLLAYTVVFGLQAVGLVASTILLDRVDVQEFRDNAKGAIAAVMEGDLE